MLALIAGGGALPEILARRLKPAPLVVAVAGAECRLAADLDFRLERMASLMAALSDRGVHEVCFAGAVGRPSLDPAAIEPETMPYLARIQEALGKGDDAALRVLLSIFETAGFAVRAAQDVAPDLLAAPPGTLTARGGLDAGDLRRAREIHAALGAADVGQAVVVKAGQALALETRFGTDWMLASLARRPDGRGGLLFKAPKPGQDLRIDLPAIGPGTVAGAVDAGLDAIAVAAGGVLVLDREATVAAADAAGLVIEAVDPGE